jgi:hypothetical protein
MKNKPITSIKIFTQQNALPSISICTPLLDEGITLYIQTKEKKSKTQLTNKVIHLQILIVVGCQILHPTYRIKAHILHDIVNWMMQHKTNGL